VLPRGLGTSPRAPTTPVWARACCYHASGYAGVVASTQVVAQENPVVQPISSNVAYESVCRIVDVRDDPELLAEVEPCGL
jgi:hypothetical protein